MNKLKIFWINLSRWQHCMYEGTTGFGELLTKETTLERADFALQLSIFVTAEKEKEIFVIFFLSSFCQLLSPRF